MKCIRCGGQMFLEDFINNGILWKVLVCLWCGANIYPDGGPAKSAPRSRLSTDSPQSVKSIS